ncbi:hypothetical protein [Pseudomonas phage ZQG1]|jgi:hypothetical protein|nr:hypothetical protein [Pseudomonas phage ZQG1]
MTSQEIIDNAKCNTHGQAWNFPRRTYNCGCVMGKHLWQTRITAVETAKQKEDRDALSN